MKLPSVQVSYLSGCFTVIEYRATHSDRADLMFRETLNVTDRKFKGEVAPVPWCTSGTLGTSTFTFDTITAEFNFYLYFRINFLTIFVSFE